MKESIAALGASPEQIEADIQAELAKGQPGIGGFLMPEEREGNILKFQESTFLEARWFTETRRPELTLHIERVGTYVNDSEGQASVNPFEDIHPGVVFVEGPFDLTFTLNEPILPIHYSGADVEATVMDIPLHFTGFQLSALELTAYFDDPLEPLLPQPGEALTPERERELQRVMVNTSLASGESIRGLWTKGGVT